MYGVAVISSSLAIDTSSPAVLGWFLYDESFSMLFFLYSNEIDDIFLRHKGSQLLPEC
jgi:hypothetical protein